MLRGSKKSHKKIFRNLSEDGENDNGSMRHKCKSKSLSLFMLEAGFGCNKTRQKLASRFFLTSMYRNSGNFRVKKFSYQNIFVPATPYRSNMHTLYTAMKNFVHLIFVHNCAYENFPNYGIKILMKLT